MLQVLVHANAKRSLRERRLQKGAAMLGCALLLAGELCLGSG